MKRFKNMSRTKKIVAAGLTVGLTLGLAGSAFAYFTSTGTGSGNASVGNATNWAVAGGSVVGTLYPVATYSGTPEGVVTGASVTNPAINPANQKLNQIVATISGVTSGSNPLYSSEAACSTSDFQFNSPTATWTGSGTQTATILPNVDLTPGASYSISDLNVTMVDHSAAQDNCQGQTVTVTFNAS